MRFDFKVEFGFSGSLRVRGEIQLLVSSIALEEEIRVGLFNSPLDAEVDHDCVRLE